MLSRLLSRVAWLLFQRSAVQCELCGVVIERRKAWVAMEFVACSGTCVSDLAFCRHMPVEEAERS